jgi:hypothetical protein
MRAWQLLSVLDDSSSKRTSSQSSLPYYDVHPSRFYSHSLSVLPVSSPQRPNASYARYITLPSHHLVQTSSFLSIVSRWCQSSRDRAHAAIEYLSLGVSTVQRSFPSTSFLHFDRPFSPYGTHITPSLALPSTLKLRSFLFFISFLPSPSFLPAIILSFPTSFSLPLTSRTIVGAEPSSCRSQRQIRYKAFNRKL